MNLDRATIEFHPYTNPKATGWLGWFTDKNNNPVGYLGNDLQYVPQATRELCRDDPYPPIRLLELLEGDEPYMLRIAVYGDGADLMSYPLGRIPAGSIVTPERKNDGSIHASWEELVPKLDWAYGAAIVGERVQAGIGLTRIATGETTVVVDTTIPLHVWGKEDIVRLAPVRYKDANTQPAKE